MAWNSPAYGSRDNGLLERSGVGVNDVAFEPLFPHAHAALLFAFRYNLEQYDPTPIAALMKRKEGALGTGKGLVGMDGASQAGRIRYEVSQLPKLEQLVIAARFGVGVEKLQAAQDLLKPCLGQLPSGIHKPRIIDALIIKFFKVPYEMDRKEVAVGQYAVQWRYTPIRLLALADKYNSHRVTVGNHWAIVRKYLSMLEKRADEMIYERLLETGIIESSETA